MGIPYLHATPYWAYGGRIEDRTPQGKFNDPSHLYADDFGSGFHLHLFVWQKHQGYPSICGNHCLPRCIPSSTNGVQDKLFPYAASAVTSWVETAGDELAEVARDYEKQCKEVGF